MNEQDESIREIVELICRPIEVLSGVEVPRETKAKIFKRLEALHRAS